ncbi:MAG: 16S rRNA (adenine(1518)-N(6)/adenine(1519)-N(6))-dimethyltransferase RsmA [Actinomycetota bacterium]|nr:16S rRNA (adenine(1518)-N(6)/adenine(1519)-N(6))-dimethyltransferase RsmA [Actinomycetota bacterium]
MSLATPGKTIEILKKFNIRLSKRLGQNFLVDQNVLGKIVKIADLKSTDVVLEVGPGIGTLTQELAKRASAVLAVEIDKKLLAVLGETLKGFDNVKLLQLDALDLDLDNLPPNIPQPSKMVSNLPYNIASPLLIKFLVECPRIDEFVFMIQREVADRIIASPGCKDYGILTLKIQYHARPEIAFFVSRRAFLPSPEVDSAVVKLMRLPSPPAIGGVGDSVHLFQVIEAAFGHRRKTVRNALLTSDLGYEKGWVERALRVVNIDPHRRGETLSLEEFARLSEALSADSRRSF